MNDLLQVFLLSMTPVGELRLSIPVGILIFHLSPIWVIFISIIGNFALAAFFLFFLKKISLVLAAKSRVFQKLFSYWENNAREKHSAKIQKYGAIGLFAFVAIPLPLTGVWTGALLATLVGMPLKKSLPAIFLGVITAGLLVFTIVVSGINIEKYLGWQILVGLLGLGSILFIVQKFLVFKK